MEGEALKRLVSQMVGLIGRRCQQDCSGTLRTGNVISLFAGYPGRMALRVCSLA